MLLLSNSLGLYCRYRWLSFEVFVSIITLVQDYILLSAAGWSVTPCARIKLRFKTFKIEYFGAFGLKILSK